MAGGNTEYVSRKQTELVKPKVSVCVQGKDSKVFYVILVAARIVEKIVQRTNCRPGTGKV